MNLILVTFKGDLTEFLVDAPDFDTAISKAIGANSSKELGFVDKGSKFEKDIADPDCYYAECVDDMNFLRCIVARNDYWGKINEAIVFKD